jgi:hypothetical protein
MIEFSRFDAEGSEVRDESSAGMDAPHGEQHANMFKLACQVGRRVAF